MFSEYAQVRNVSWNSRYREQYIPREKTNIFFADIIRKTAGLRKTTLLTTITVPNKNVHRSALSQYMTV